MTQSQNISIQYWLIAGAIIIFVIVAILNYKPLKRLIPLFLILFFLFIVVNFYDYSNDIYSFQPFNVKYFSPAYINVKGLNFYISLVTLASFVLIYIQWTYKEYMKEKAEINILFEELHHCLNIIDAAFLIYNEETFYRRLYEHLAVLKPYQLYPNPTDFGGSDTTNYLELIEGIGLNVQPVNLDFNLIKLPNNGIRNLISSKNIFNLKKHRIYINLGHLNYSLERHNRNLEIFNSIHPENSSKRLDAFRHIQNEYLAWLHFRIHFILLDVVLQDDENVIIDQQFKQNILNKVKAFNP